MKKLVTTLPVDIALRTLNAADVKYIRGWFERLQHWEKDKFVRTHSHELEDFPGVYVLPTESELWIFFRFDGNAVTVLDIGSKAAILASGGL